MKFERLRSSAQPTLVSTDDIVLANRFEERRARIEADRRGPSSPEMSRRVGSLFVGLIAELNAKPGRAPRWRGLKEPAVPMTLEQMAELWRDNPARLSEEALARPSDGER